MGSESDRRTSEERNEVHKDVQRPDAQQIPRQEAERNIYQGHPHTEGMAEVVHGLLRHINIPGLTRHHARAPVLAIFSFINGCLSIGLMAIVALVTRSPFIFPSLGPTAFLFFYTPRAPSASPRNTLVGHTLGILAGYSSLVVTGLTTAGPALSVGMTWPRVLAAAISLGLTAGLMVLCRAPHPPAGATTLIISLGILTQPWQLVLLLIAVIMLTIQAIAINRLAGIPYPLWSPNRERKRGSDSGG